MSRSVTIRISRNQGIASDRSIAILKLNKLYHYVGQPVMVKYYSKPDVIDTILALGIKDGIGEDCYKIISLGGLELVRGVVSDPPPIHLLIHGELYLYRNNDKVWNYVYSVNGSRVIEEIKNLADTVFVNIEDNYKWYWSNKDKELKREDDFKSSEQMDYILDELFLSIGSPKLNVSSELGYLFNVGDIVDLPLKITLKNALGDNLFNRCIFYIDGIEARKLSNDRILLENANKNKTEYFIEAVTKSNNGKIYRYNTYLIINFGYKFYYGIVNSDWEVSITNIIGLDSELHCKENVKLGPINLVNQKIVYAYPLIYGELEHIYDEYGLDHIFSFSTTKINVSGLDYLVYIKKDPIIINNLIQEFCFHNQVETRKNLDTDKYNEIISAWDKRNQINGIVQLDNDGKISNNLIKGFEFTSELSFVNIVSFLDHYPEGTLNIGDKWYNTEEKMIFEATATDRGINYKPSENTIYLNKQEKTIYFWDSTNMNTVGETISSSKITNVISILNS